MAWPSASAIWNPRLGAKYFCSSASPKQDATARAVATAGKSREPVLQNQDALVCSVMPKR